MFNIINNYFQGLGHCTCLFLLVFRVASSSIKNDSFLIEKNMLTYLYVSCVLIRVDYFELCFFDDRTVFRRMIHLLDIWLTKWT